VGGWLAEFSADLGLSNRISFFVAMVWHEQENEDTHDGLLPIACRIWKDKLPAYCVASKLALPIDRGCGQRRTPRLSLLKNDYLLLHTHQQLACAVGAYLASGRTISSQNAADCSSHGESDIQSVCSLWNEGVTCICCHDCRSNILSQTCMYVEEEFVILQKLTIFLDAHLLP
jgi:hypothetical protein